MIYAMFRYRKHKQATRLQNRVVAWVYDLTHGNSVATTSIKWLMLPLRIVHINTSGLRILETFPVIDMLIHQTWFEFRSDFHFSDVSTFQRLHIKAAFCFSFIRKFTFPEKTSQISCIELHFALSDVRVKGKFFFTPAPTSTEWIENDGVRRRRDLHTQKCLVQLFC